MVLISRIFPNDKTLLLVQKGFFMLNKVKSLISFKLKTLINIEYLN